MGDDIYVTDREGFLYTIRDSAELDWRADRTGTLEVGENVYVSNNDLIALDAENSEIRWSADDRNEPNAENELLYVTDDENVVAYTADGNERWRAECDGEIATEPVVTEETVFVGGNGWVGAFDAQDGGTRWTYDGDCGDLGSVERLTALENRAFVVADGRITALDSHGEQWSAGENASILTASGASGSDDSGDAGDSGSAGGAVYAGIDGNEVIAYDFDGNEQWRATPENGDSVSHLVGGETPADGVYAVTTAVTSTGTDRREWLAALSDGEERWAFHPKYLPFGSLCEPVVAGETVYVGASDRRVYALSATNGTELHRFETGDEVRSVGIDTNGEDDRVYAASDSVYAFE
ncbi:hypothetical protein GCM10009000_072010 [Halobacterium noricense]|uniref:Pyrrolo-quinoline quinone repeat domain-containing protein n=1 Tax=Haladaptatus pallidirubidus TaxID=1008152 RepID=A0AAV3UL51_9EURY